MTTVSMFSIKGAPGVTTLACLLGAAWPVPGPVLVVEADPSGGDLAARFGLSVHSGWNSLVSATRRSGESTSVHPHLQELPGGLPVLVGARGDERRGAGSHEGRLIRELPEGDSGQPGASGGLTIVDLGRLSAGDEVSESWLACSDVALLVVRGDASGAVRLRDRAGRLADAVGCGIGVVAVGTGYTSLEIAEFAERADVDAVADIPLDSAAADVASGASGAGRRLDRSLLWVSTVRMATTLAGRVREGKRPGFPDAAPDPVVGSPEPTGRPTGPDGDLVTLDGDAPAGPPGRLRGRSGRPVVTGRVLGVRGGPVAPDDADAAGADA